MASPAGQGGTPIYSTNNQQQYAGAGSPPSSMQQQQQQTMLFSGQQGPPSAMQQQPPSFGAQMSPGFIGSSNGAVTLNQQPNPQLMLPPGLDRDKLQGMSQRMQQLRQAGQTEQTSPELAQISQTFNVIQRHVAKMKHMQMLQQQQQQQQQQQAQSPPASIPNMQQQHVPGQLFSNQQDQQQRPQLLQQNGQQEGQNGMSAAPGYPSSAPSLPPMTLPSAGQPMNGQQANGNSFAAPSPSHDTQQQQDSTPQTATFPNRHVQLNAQQMDAFRNQIFALRFLQKGEPIPAHIAAVIFNPPNPGSGSPTPPLPFIAKTEPQSAATPSSSTIPLQQQQQLPNQQNIVPTPDAIPPATTSGPQSKEASVEPEIEIEEIPPTLIAPYNAYKDPRQVLAALRANVQAESIRTAPFIPSLMPAGLDPYTLQAERSRFLEARIAQRKRELEAMPSLLGDRAAVDVDQLENLPAEQKLELLSSQKLKALIELKSLNLLQKQRQMREDVSRGLNQAISLNLVTDRNAYRATRKITLKDARIVDQLERQQKIDRDNRAKQKHVDQLLAISKHGKAMEEAHTARRLKMQRLGKNIMRWHVEAEKEEQKRIERISKERLKALKNNDEEAYMKLIDTAKDTRITHLLRQTDTFLDSLSQAVAVQQAEASDRDPMAMDGQQPDTTTDGEVDESAFGAVPVFEEEPQDKGKADYYNVAHRIKETVSEQPTILTGGTLKEYQIKGLQWMTSLYNNRLNGILADEMGLGKTIQTISLITFLIEKKKQNGPFLCIVPLSTLPNWTLEFAKWAPSVKVIIYKGGPPVRKSIQGKMKSEGFQVCLTTYEYIIKDRPFLARYKWVHMIIDEGHRMKNTQSKLSVTLTQYYNSRYRLILTGTPLQNNLPELWALLNFVLPKVFNSQKSFDEWFNTPFANTGGQDKIDINEEEALLIIRRLHKVLRPFLLRRLKKDVESELPDKVERLIRCKMSSLQLKLYKQMKDTGMLITDDGKGSKAGMRGLQNTIMQLRKICNHPFVFGEVENLINPTSTSNPLLYRVAGKFELLDRILPKLFQGGHRVLMFFQMTEVMNIMEDYLRYRNTTFLRLDGSTKPDERSDMLKEFNDPKSTIPIFLLSTRAGGLGLNLQTADTVIIYDSDWNPHQDLQAQDRAHRIGQKKEVRIFRLVTEKSIEEHILARAREKLEIDKKVIQGGRFDNKSSAAEREDFLRAILESNEEDEEDTADLGDDELNDILARGEDEAELFTRMDLERIRNEELNWIRSGHSGPVPPRLISDAELPEVYHIEHVIQPVVHEVLDQRRKKGAIHYDDGLTEEQFLNALEDENDSLQNVIERNRRQALGVGDDYSGSEGMGQMSGLQDWDSEAGSPGPGGRKRKRALVGGSRATSVDMQSLNGDVKGAQPKRRKTGKQSYADVPERVQMKAVMDACMDTVEDVDNPDYGHQCAGLFYKLPSKKDYPEYFIIILKPICLDQIKKKISTWKYDTLDEYVADFRLMFNNARTFNDESSIVYRDVNLMEAAFNEKFAEMTSATAQAPPQNNSLAMNDYMPMVKQNQDSDDDLF